MNPNRCLIVFNRPSENALADELDVLDQVAWVRQHLEKLGISVSEFGITGNFYAELTGKLAGFDGFVFNLAESVDNHGELNYFAPAICNMMQVPYSGCPLEALFVTSGKILAKQMMRQAGIPVTDSFYPDEPEKMVSGRKYILKPLWQDGSLDLDEYSVFTAGCEGNLLRDKNRAYWFVEEFVDGREFNVSLLAGTDGPDGPEVLPPAEIEFTGYDDGKPKVVGYKAKWDKDSFEYHNTRRVFPETGDILYKKLADISKQCWRLFGLKGYARVDFRVDADGTPYVLEVNANPCIAPDSGFVAATIHRGHDFTNVIRRIINDLNGWRDTIK